MKKPLLLASAVVFILAGLGAAAFLSATKTRELALAEFSVRNLTCGSCVGNIRGALSSLKGIGAVEVSVTMGRASVEYDPERIEPEAIAGRIVRAGYPAALNQVLDVADYRSFKEDESRLAERFVGRIGDRLVSRDAFASMLSRFEGDRAALRQGLLRTVWQELVQRELLLAAAEKNGVVVRDEEVDLEVDRMRKGNEGFDTIVEGRYGGAEDLRQLLKEQMIIQRNIEEYVLAGEHDSTTRRLKLDRWYRELTDAAPIRIFDPALKAAVNAAGSGCGGSCCG